MPLLEAQLRVKRSTLPNAGKGLFTTRPIARGEKIVEYKGTITTWKGADNNDCDNGYLYYVNRNHAIDARRHLRHLARYANDAMGISRAEGFRNNCSYETEGLRVFIVAQKAIPAGSELFVAYGPEYWAAIRYNIRHGFMK